MLGALAVVLVDQTVRFTVRTNSWVAILCKVFAVNGGGDELLGFMCYLMAGVLSIHTTEKACDIQSGRAL